MHRFYVPTVAVEASELWLAGREAHHGLHVLRVRRGESVIVLDGVGHEFRCQVGEVRLDQVQLLVFERRTHPPLRCQLTLLQALPKGKTIETIIQKATELGAARVVPLLSERSVPQLDSEAAEGKVSKWQAVAIESIKQCGSPWLPRIDPPLALRQFLLSGERFDITLVGSLQRERRHPRECLKTFHADHGRPPQSVGVWIGPEGDFTLAELEAIQAAGACPISLGPLVLRADTAAIYSLSILNYELLAGGDAP